jgi:hypothetical protein
MPKYSAVTLCSLTVNVKNPRNDPSDHCKSGFRPISCWLSTFAGAGKMPSPKGEGDVTAVPANSTPMAPFPVTGSYLQDEKREDEN